MKVPMGAQLALRYEFDAHDDFGWLEAHFSTAKTSGKMGFWVQWQDVREWASELATFPMRSRHRSGVDWGQFESGGGNYRPIIKVVIRASELGRLDVAVNLADYADERVSCRGVFTTDFPALQRFADDLASVMNKKQDEAILIGLNVP